MNNKYKIIDSLEALGIKNPMLRRKTTPDPEIWESQISYTNDQKVMFVKIETAQRYIKLKGVTNE